MNNIFEHRNGSYYKNGDLIFLQRATLKNPNWICEIDEKSSEILKYKSALFDFKTFEQNPFRNDERAMYQLGKWALVNIKEAPRMIFST